MVALKVKIFEKKAQEVKTSSVRRMLEGQKSRWNCFWYLIDDR
ncbi:hypothetical protein GGR08_000533 [Bartonella fuyuanensis]|uniref:Uncharacterized protein n=1 Tax=Bartonella fuyuanensis TaxID=1460968 RepID=A0A840DTE7_9HYPH|nr:hypothetical protein [Bartonella fuyuanensis]